MPPNTSALKPSTSCNPIYNQPPLSHLSNVIIVHHLAVDAPLNQARMYQSVAANHRPHRWGQFQTLQITWLRCFSRIIPLPGLVMSSCLLAAVPCMKAWLGELITWSHYFLLLYFITCFARSVPLTWYILDDRVGLSVVAGEFLPTQCWPGKPDLLLLNMYN